MTLKRIVFCFTMYVVFCFNSSCMKPNQSTEESLLCTAGEQLIKAPTVTMVPSQKAPAITERRTHHLSISVSTREITESLGIAGKPGTPVDDDDDKDTDEAAFHQPIGSIVLLARQQLCPIENSKIILSIDGGGTRGIIPLCYLKALKEAVGHPLKFDMIAGTSVGALVGAAVALNKTDEISGDKFQELATGIFTKNWFSWGGMWKPVYSSDGRLNKITELTKDISGKALNVDFIAPFYSLLTREAKIYKNFGADDSEDFRLADVLMMTSAAPTYFNPHTCRSLAGRKYEGVDGGIFANHPGLIAYHEARAKYPTAKLIMISLGTGKHNLCNVENQSLNRGLVYWGRSFPNISIDATSFNIHHSLAALSEADSNFTYIRLQPSLEKSYMLTDCVNPEHLRRLDDLAKSSIGIGKDAREKFLQAVYELESRDKLLKFQSSSSN